MLTTTTRRFNLTRHKSEFKLDPFIASTSQTVTTSTFFEPKPTTSSGAVAESAILVDQSAVLETSVPETPEGESPADDSPRFSSDKSLQFKLETLVSLGEESEDSEETLTGITEAVVVQGRAEDSEKKHLRGQPKLLSRNSWRLQWRVLSLTQQISARFLRVESKKILWNSSSIFLQQYNLPRKILMG